MLIQPVFTPVDEKFIIYSDEYLHLHTVLIVRMLFLILNQKCLFDTFTFWCLLYGLAPLMEISPLNSEFRVLNWIHSGLSGITPIAPHHSEAILIHQVWSLEFIMPGVDWWIQSRERPLLSETGRLYPFGGNLYNSVTVAKMCVNKYLICLNSRRGPKFMTSFYLSSSFISLFLALFPMVWLTINLCCYFRYELTSITVLY